MLFINGFSFILLLVLTYSSDKNKEKVVRNLAKALYESDNLSWAPLFRAVIPTTELYDEIDCTNSLDSHMKKISRRKSSAGEAVTSRLLKKPVQTWNFKFICEKDEIQKVEETKKDAYTSLLDLYTRVMYCKNNTERDRQNTENLINKERFSKKELESIENFAHHRSLQNAPHSQYKISEKQTSRKNNVIDMFELAKQEEAKEEPISKFAEATFNVSEEDQKRNDMIEELKKTMVFLSMLDEIEAINGYLINYLCEEVSEEVEIQYCENRNIHTKSPNAMHHHLNDSIQRLQNINLTVLN